MNRRGFLAGIGALLAAPAIVRAAQIMPVKASRLLTNEELFALLQARMNDVMNVTMVHMSEALYGNVADEPNALFGMLIKPQRQWTSYGAQFVVDVRGP